MSPEFPLTPLGAPLSGPQREELTRALERLLVWQRDLTSWRAPSQAPDATPIVSLYALGSLCGCAGISVGEPGERVARAFLQALGDARFGGIDAAARAEVVCQVSFPIAPERVTPAELLARLEVGTHGLALVPEHRRPVTILPDVARDHRLDAEGLVRALEAKSGSERAAWPEHGLFLFRSERVLARLTRAPELELPEDPLEAAAGWLARMVDADGKTWFGLDPRKNERFALSPMLHGRVAIALRALLSQTWGRGAAVRARRVLEQELRAALAGEKIPGFPQEPALLGGTLALAQLAGLDFEAALSPLAERAELRAVPWHAAQVVAALGARAPDTLYRACLDGLESERWAPWTALAAHARGDAEAYARCADALCDAIREGAPHAGGVGEPLPELARTAATIEALAFASGARVQAARERAQGFLLRNQLRGSDHAAARAPELVHGAFPASPVHDFLQVDVTGHALLALSSARAALSG